MDIRTFLYTNHLKQVELAQYLGITEASVSRMCKGISNPSKENLSKILNNDKGWDVSALLPASITQTIGDHSSHNTQIVGERSDRPASVSPEQAEVIKLMAEEITHLREQIAWMKGIIDDYRQAGK